MTLIDQLEALLTSKRHNSWLREHSGDVDVEVYVRLAARALSLADGAKSYLRTIEFANIPDYSAERAINELIRFAETADRDVVWVETVHHKRLREFLEENGYMQLDENELGATYWKLTEPRSHVD